MALISGLHGGTGSRTIEANPAKSLEAARLKPLENRLCKPRAHGEEASQVAEKIAASLVPEHTNQSAERIESAENRLESIMPQTGKCLCNWRPIITMSFSMLPPGWTALENSFGELAGKAGDSGLGSGLKALEQETLSMKEPSLDLEETVLEKNGFGSE